MTKLVNYFGLLMKTFLQELPDFFSSNLDSPYFKHSLYYHFQLGSWHIIYLGVKGSVPRTYKIVGAYKDIVNKKQKYEK